MGLGTRLCPQKGRCPSELTFPGCNPRRPWPLDDPRPIKKLELDKEILADQENDEAAN